MELFLEFLITNLHLKKVLLTSPEYTDLERYIWRDPSAYLVVHPLKRRAYFSHGSAAHLHGLAGQNENKIYLNHEQTAKKKAGGALLQESIHRAFANKPRQSKLIYRYRDSEITVINGKNTNRYGVEELITDSGEAIQVTNKERTLVDIAVRPVYSNGPQGVSAVFFAAKDSVSASRVFTTLRAMEYIYPYHQTIGFYMERAGYPNKDLDQFRTVPIEFDFYLDNQLDDEKRFDGSWRVFYPKTLD